MQRIAIEPRANWKETVESQGLLFSEEDGHQFWDESAYYRLTERDVVNLEEATRTLHEMCIQAATRLIEENRLDEVGVPPPYHGLVRESWERDDPSLYGRFAVVGRRKAKTCSKL